VAKNLSTPWQISTDISNKAKVKKAKRKINGTESFTGWIYWKTFAQILINSFSEFMNTPAIQSESAISLERAHTQQAMAALGKAFANDPLMKYVIPDEDKRPQATPELYGGIIRYALLYGKAYTTSNVDGAACWLPPDQSSPSLLRMLKAGMLKVPFLLGWKSYRRLTGFEAQAEILHKRHATQPHWYLWALGVDPACQGKGFGGILLQPILARADREKTPCYLETQNEKNLHFYEKHGFEVCEHKEVFKNAVNTWAMLRQPQR
jgi:ribosomal protein S18 acetylase RimI-like enzyme